MTLSCHSAQSTSPSIQTAASTQLPPSPADGAGPCWAREGYHRPDGAREDQGAGAAAGAAERQDQRKAELDVHRRDVRFAVGNEVLLDTEHTPLPSRSRLSPRWMGPFKVLAFPAPNTYCLDVPALAT
jgi:hypothetical protein